MLLLDALLNVADGRALPEAPPLSDVRPSLDRLVTTGRFLRHG